MSEAEIPQFLVRFLAEAMTWAEGAPEHGTQTGVHCYIGRMTVVCEGEVIGELVNEDPEWVYRTVKP